MPEAWTSGDSDGRGGESRKGLHLLALPESLYLPVLYGSDGNIALHTSRRRRTELRCFLSVRLDRRRPWRIVEDIGLQVKWSAVELVFGRA